MVSCTIFFFFNSGSINPTVFLTTPEKTVKWVVFIDFSADANLMDVHFSEQLNLKEIP